MTDQAVDQISADDPAAVVRQVKDRTGPFYRVEFEGDDQPAVGLAYIRFGIGTRDTDLWPGKPRKTTNCYQCKTELAAGTLLIYRYTGFIEARETWCLGCARSHYGVWRSAKTTEREIPVPPTLYFGLDAKLRYGQLPG